MISPAESGRLDEGRSPGRESLAEPVACGYAVYIQV